MSNEHILLISSKPETNQLLERAALIPAGYKVTSLTKWKPAEDVLLNNPPDLVIMGDVIEDHGYAELAHSLLERYPFLPLILLPDKHSDNLAVDAFRQGFIDYLQPPVRTNDVQLAVSRALDRRRRWEDQVKLETKKGTKSLRKRVNGMEAIQRIGRKVTSLLDLDSILTSVVDAAVELTAAEEGSLLLLDEDSGELYMRASRNFQEDFVNTFRLPIRDTLAGQVLRTGKALLIDEKTPRKIKTSYLVYTIIYVPLIVQERVIGVLEVDNRHSRKSFSDYHVTLVSALADYAAIAIENSRLYSRSELERNKLETILKGIEESVIVVDHDRRVILINHKALDAFKVEEKNLIGKRIREVLNHQELLEVFGDKSLTNPSRVELSLEDGRVLNAQLTPIPEIGLVVTMQDITHLKELDRIKSDFVNTVSHDLRSPLTAILGYVELIDRVGPVNAQQIEFIRRVQISVHNITALINDLLDLGRIEAGFDARKEIVPFSTIIHYAIDGLRSRIDEKSLDLVLEIPENLADVLGNPVRLRQMVSNLLSNAVKYTPKHGKISMRAHSEGEQVIIQITDSGPGIPPADQPFIFDKFYRASNVPADTPGTGLGLAIVKSIVENHLGRIWIDSALGQGTTFTIVLPIAGSKL
ncbi:MAG: GAF domain-containing protein [Anaerolineales bacterium]|nr:GAF domain-containing protein [Anaerolineales bacterium]